MYRVIAKRAELLITVSEFSASELAEVLEVPLSRFSVVPNGHEHFSDRIPTEPAFASDINEPFVLCVGTIAIHKNLEWAVKALLSRDIKVVVVGASGKQSVFSDQRPITQGQTDRLIVAGRLSEDELAWCYEKAAVLVFPSLYEGFGLPIIEAQSRDCPVVSSNRASLPEVAGNASLYFDPTRESELLAAVAQVLESEKVAERLKQRGKENVRRFSWSESVTKVEDLLMGSEQKA